MTHKSLLASLLLASYSFIAFAQNNAEKPASKLAGSYSSLKFRLLGPALTSGRISDITVHPKNDNVWYIAVASGGVWKTENHGTSFAPIFDSQSSFSTSCVVLAPSNPNVVWVGSGENNNQRSVAYGDGVYKSIDGGKSFVNMGLKTSEHIGNIIIHPTDENTIWVAAYGPLWSKGGERGVYKSTDGGKTWKRTLQISDYTGISEIAIDPNDPKIMYASAHQRQRREWAYVGGGPESGLYKSEDSGETWREINNGLPKSEMGRIGIAVSPADPNYIYAIVEAKYDKGGFFQSTDKGESWSKMSNWTTSGNYYQEIIPDPKDRLKVFSMDTYLHHTVDGGKTFIPSGEKNKHVDNHSCWINKNNTDHWIVGCDGGIYETFNHAKDWKYYDNLPIIQFYKVATDNATPFYNIYGGTQDNNSMGGPSGSINNAGVLNSDWFITNGGDGFESAIDPIDPNIAYAQAQYGFLVRFDKNSGEKVPIQPMPGENEPAYRWNWDAPLLISPHDNKTLYFAANKVFKSSNRGDDWQTISPDLSQQIDRNKLEIMDQIWSIDAVMKNASTTIYGNIVALDESPLKKGLLYAGTDDGAVQISENDGQTWTKQLTFSGVPPNTRVNMLTASIHDENIVFAVFNNHRSGDFKPYVFISSNKGKTWRSISSNLPERGSVYCIKQDHIDPKLLFVGTEFGCYFSNDEGKTWNKISGLPTIAVMDLDIQKHENDLVAATFGRGFYVLDNYSALRVLTEDNLEKEAFLVPIKNALLYIPSNPLGNSGKSSQGSDLWLADNPEFGARFQLYLKDEFKTKSDLRKDSEKKAEKDKADVLYPEIIEYRKELVEEKALLIWKICDVNGKEIKRISSSPKKGLQQVVWKLRDDSTNPITATTGSSTNYSNGDDGFLIAPGSYSVSVHLLKDGVSRELISATKFEVVGLNNQTLLAKNSKQLIDFRNSLAQVNRSVNGTVRQLSEANETFKLLKKAMIEYPGIDLGLAKEMQGLKVKLDTVDLLLNGDKVLSSKEFETVPSINDRLGMTEYQLYANTTDVTQTHQRNLALVLKQYSVVQQIMKEILTTIEKIESTLADKKVPYIKGTLRDWKND